MNRLQFRVLYPQFLLMKNWNASVHQPIHYPPLRFRIKLHVNIHGCAGLRMPHQRLRIVHVAGSKGKGSTAAMLAQQMMAARRRLPFITTLHGTDITIVGLDRSYFPITKFSIEKSNGITCISQDVRRETHEVFGVANEIRVIYNFVNTDIYKPMEQRPNDEKGEHGSGHHHASDTRTDQVSDTHQFRRQLAADRRTA